MREKDLNKIAYKQAEKELMEQKISKVKDYILETLETMEKKKVEKARVEEEMRILKLDLEDLRQGNFKKIEERKKLSEVASCVSVDLSKDFASQQCNSLLVNNFTTQGTSVDWMTYTSGTYPLSNGKTIYYSNSN